MEAGERCNRCQRSLRNAKRCKHPNSLLWQSRRPSSESVHAPTVYEYSSTKRAWRLTTSDIFKSKRAIVRQEQSATLTWYAKRHNTTNDTMMVSRVENPPLLLSSNQDERQPQVSFRYCRHVVKITRQQQSRAVHFHIVPHVAKSYYLMMGVATARVAVVSLLLATANKTAQETFVSRLRGVTSDREENVLKYHGSSNWRGVSTQHSEWNIFF